MKHFMARMSLSVPALVEKYNTKLRILRFIYSDDRYTILTVGSWCRCGDYERFLVKGYALFISSMRSVVITYSIYPPAITNCKNSIIYNILYTVDYYTEVRQASPMLE